jgi:hypothetical protein
VSGGDAILAAFRAFGLAPTAPVELRLWVPAGTRTLAAGRGCATPPSRLPSFYAGEVSTGRARYLSPGRGEA